MDLATLLVAVTVFLVVYFWFRQHDPLLPPCPVTPLPVLGHLHLLSGDTRPRMKKWKKQCGDIYSLYVGSTLVVVLNNYDLIKEAFVKKADVFSDRPPYFVNKACEMEDTGIIFSNGPSWKEQRSVALSILRTFGMGKNLLADRISGEVSCFVNYLTSLKGKPANIRTMTLISTSNIICSILFGQRFEYEDQHFRSLMLKLSSLVGDHGNFSAINYMFWLRYLPGDYFKAKKLSESIRGVMESLMQFIEEKRRHVVDSSDVFNLIDAYTMEQNKKLKSGETTYLDDRNLLKILMDLFQAGTETSSTTIYWCILFILNYPHVQEKIFLEITDTIGVNRAPTMQDKSQMTYLNAVISETQRLASIVPLSVTHTCAEEVTLQGYTIPKGTYMMPNMDAVLFEKDTWGEDAMSFRPERFIDDKGKLKIPEQFIPFGIGRRICLGEAMANMELFLYLSSMFQKFEFLPPAPGAIPEIKYDYGIVVSPLPYQMRVVERK
jgi:cytochrome P450 family 2 subfamily J